MIRLLQFRPRAKELQGKEQALGREFIHDLLLPAKVAQKLSLILPYSFLNQLKYLTTFVPDQILPQIFP